MYGNRRVAFGYDTTMLFQFLERIMRRDGCFHRLLRSNLWVGCVINNCIKENKMEADKVIGVLYVPLRKLV